MKIRPGSNLEAASKEAERDLLRSKVTAESLIIRASYLRQNSNGKIQVHHS